MPHQTTVATASRRHLIAIAPLLVLVLTCSGIDNLDITATGRAVIPQRSVLDELLGTLSFAGFEGFDISQSQEFRNQGYTKDQIDSVQISSFTLTIESPAGASFDFLRSIRFIAQADGLPDVEIAHLDSVPAGATVLDLDVDDSLELEAYVTAPSITITTTANGMRPPEETTVRATAVFDIDVSVTGSCE